MGGEIFSSDWNVPLNRDVCLDDKAEPAAAAVALDAPADMIASLGNRCP
jgi:hypothetical protein